jgi:hypothetical protein
LPLIADAASVPDRDSRFNSRAAALRRALK